MRIDTGMLPGDLRDAIGAAHQAEADGYAGFFVAEVQNDPFLPLALAAEHTERIDLGTNIAVALARSPMTLAQTAHDLQKLSKGRMILGLGTQIRPHIERRFSMPYDKPASRIRELVLAMRAIWGCWNDGEPLKFDGEFYRHTLMTPFFNPGPTGYGPPRVWLAAVGPRMCEISGEVADGVILHAFTTEQYMREVSVPAIERGLALGMRARAAFDVAAPLFIVTGSTPEEREAAAAGARSQIAFYGSTPAYRPVLEMHGWESVGRELTGMTKRGQWSEIGSLITDEMLETFAVVAPLDELAAKIRSRVEGCIDRVMLYPTFVPSAETSAALIDAVRAV